MVILLIANLVISFVLVILWLGKQTTISFLDQTDFLKAPPTQPKTTSRFNTNPSNQLVINYPKGDFKLTKLTGCVGQNSDQITQYEKTHYLAERGLCNPETPPNAPIPKAKLYFSQTKCNSYQLKDPWVLTSRNPDYNYVFNLTSGVYAFASNGCGSGWNGQALAIYKQNNQTTFLPLANVNELSWVYRLSPFYAVVGNVSENQKQAEKNMQSGEWWHFMPRQYLLNFYLLNNKQAQVASQFITTFKYEPAGEKTWLDVLKQEPQLAWNQLGYLALPNTMYGSPDTDIALIPTSTNNFPLTLKTLGTSSSAVTLDFDENHNLWVLVHRYGLENQSTFNLIGYNTDKIVKSNNQHADTQTIAQQNQIADIYLPQLNSIDPNNQVLKLEVKNNQAKIFLVNKKGEIVKLLTSVKVK